MTFQFKIEISGYKNPEIWRRIIVPSHRTFYQFQRIISTVFDLKEIHTYYSFLQKNEGGETIITSNKYVYDNQEYDKSVLLSDKFFNPGDFVTYTIESYRWLAHRIEFEAINNEDILSAVCLAGEGAFPPYACSGPEDYDEMKQALANKNHPKHQRTLEWLELNENETWEEKYRFDLLKVNDELRKSDFDVKLFRNYILTDQHILDVQYNMTSSILLEISQILQRIRREGKNKHIIRKLEKLTEKYPKVPHFRDILYNTCFSGVDDEKYFKMMRQLMADFPDFVLTLVNLVYYYKGKEKRCEIAQLLGEKFDLCTLFPKRNGRFSKGEIFQYHWAVFNHCLSVRHLKEAALHLDYLEYLDPDGCKKLDLELSFHQTLNLKEGDELKEEWVVKVIPEQVENTLSEPKFKFQEIYQLYEHKGFISKEKRYQIMTLPREPLINDLEKVLIDSIARFYSYSYVKPKMSYAPIHALFFLAALKAEEALSTFFTVLRQTKDYYDRWYDDALFEQIGFILYHLGQNRLDRLKDFAFEPNRYTFSRTAIADTLMVVAYYHPERKEEVITILVEMIQFMLDHKDEKESKVFEHYVYLYWLECLIHISDKEQLPLILRLYDEQLIERQERFTMQELKISLVSPPPFYITKKLMITIDDFYDEWSEFDYDDMDDDDDDDSDGDDGDDNFDDNDKNDVDGNPSYPKWDDPQSPFVSEKVAGRNDPCPCGSGKKYKKCCGAN